MTPTKEEQREKLKTYFVSFKQYSFEEKNNVKLPE